METIEIKDMENKKIDNGSILNVRTSNFFVIEWVDKEDEFNYQCFFEITVGSSKYRFQISRDGKEVDIELQIHESSDYLMVDENKRHVQEFRRTDIVVSPHSFKTIGSVIYYIKNFLGLTFLY